MGGIGGLNVCSIPRLIKGSDVDVDRVGDSFSEVKIVHMSMPIIVGILGGGHEYAPRRSKYL